MCPCTIQTTKIALLSTVKQSIIKKKKTNARLVEKSFLFRLLEITYWPMNLQLTRDFALLILASAGGIGWVVAALVDCGYFEIFKDPSN